MNNKGIALIVSVLIVVAVLLAGFGIYYFSRNNSLPSIIPSPGIIPSPDVIISPSEPIFCTQEAKQCPDGSYVGRTGPRCEFTKCQDVIPIPVPNPIVDCPQYSSPAPGWCSDGTILPPIKGSNGCYGHPICLRNTNQ